MKVNNEKVLIAYKQSASLYKALKQQKEWHNKGVISIISHEPLKTNNETNQLLKYQIVPYNEKDYPSKENLSYRFSQSSLI